MAKFASLVEKATSDHLVDPDWAINLEISDLLNSNPLDSKDVMKAVKRRIGNRNSKIQLLALMLLEMLVKNCGEYVWCQVVETNILQKIIKLAQQTVDLKVRDKILMLILAWKEAFGGPGGKFPQFFWAYNELRMSGLVFPQLSGDSVPIITPPARQLSAPTPQVVYGIPVHVARQLDETRIFDANNRRSVDMKSAYNVTSVLEEILDAINPRDHQALKDEVVLDLVNQCCINQKRIVELINMIEDEAVLKEALTLSDNLQAVLAKYDAKASYSPSPPEQVQSTQELHAASPVPQKVEKGCKSEDGEMAHLVPRSEPIPMESLTLNVNQFVGTDHDKIAQAVHDSEELESRVPVIVPHDEKGMDEAEDGDDNDGFSQLARRHSMAQSTPYRSDKAASSQASLAHISSQISASAGTMELVVVEQPPLSRNCHGRNIDPVDYARSRCELHMQATPVCEQKPDYTATEVLQHYLPEQLQMHSWKLPSNNHMVLWARDDLPQSASFSGVSDGRPPQNLFSQASLSNPFAYPPPPWELKEKSFIPMLVPSQPLYWNRVPPYYAEDKLQESHNDVSSEDTVLALQSLSQEVDAAFQQKTESSHASNQSSACNGACINQTSS
ncbi:TOM1-like protein 6 isoform X2 [Nymphaea colorata]|uniref:TOM1-like protein 6 isoform X2 n=1 Tax=Nymphaea colorata TaxID=210225 RepID=UPI00129E3750|nr:TOM1-like protein 6 isoform X2 [Nymphaea colorata]